MKFSFEPIDKNAMTITVGTVVTQEIFIAIGKKLEAIQRVRELHTKSVVNDGFPSQCTLCGYEYPCVTIKALDGEQ